MKLESLLEEQGIRYEKHAHATTYTAQRLADAEHVSGYMVAKPVVVKAESGYAMCVLPAPKHLDLRRVADALHERDVQLASEAEMAELFPDCELGAEPPVGWEVQECRAVVVRTNAETFVQQEGVTFGSSGAVAVIQSPPLDRQAVFGIAEYLFAVAFHVSAAFEPDAVIPAPLFIRLAARLGTAVALGPDEP